MSRGAQPTGMGRTPGLGPSRIRRHPMPLLAGLSPSCPRAWPVCTTAFDRTPTFTGGSKTMGVPAQFIFRGGGELPRKPTAVANSPLHAASSLPSPPLSPPVSCPTSRAPQARNLGGHLPPTHKPAEPSGTLAPISRLSLSLRGQGPCWLGTSAPQGLEGQPRWRNPGPERGWD